MGFISILKCTVISSAVNLARMMHLDVLVPLANFNSYIHLRKAFLVEALLIMCVITVLLYVSFD